MNFADRLIQNCEAKNSFLMAGLDPQVESIPHFLISEAEALKLSDKAFTTRVLANYCRLIIDACRSEVAVIKPNIAFFERYAEAGLAAWAEVCAYINSQDLLLLADVKRGDIANTAQAYSDGLLAPHNQFCSRQIENLKLDAITINPFLGLDTVEPYLAACKQWNKGLFVLCRTSNPGANFLQSFSKDGISLSQTVAQQAHIWGQELLGSRGYSAVGVVVGATYPEEAKALRALMPHNIFLIPGAGTQGADMQMACAGFDSNQSGAIINVSRALVKDLQSTNSAQEFISQVQKRAQTFRQEINRALGL